MKADRRTVIAGGAAGLGVAALVKTNWPDSSIPGTLGGADLKRGHHLRDGKFPAATREETVGVVIAGGGVAGLTAGWMLAEAGFTDFRLLELEDSLGGNARSGRNAISAYPLGAHYLPIPNREARALRHMLTRFGMITGEEGGVPVYDPYQLCSDLQERLFWRGKWQEGLFPKVGLTPKDEADRDRFSKLMAEFSAALGKDGKPAFSVPSVYSSAEPAFTKLDRMTFAAWLDQQGLTSPVLRAHVRYCCRDDYGCEPEHVSAWAGILYFAGRRGWAAGEVGDSELTWPEGNARLIQAMAQPIAKQIAPGRTVFRVEQSGEGAVVDSFDHAAGVTIRTHAKAAILAMPHFIASRIAPTIKASAAFTYAPWIVANVSTTSLPKGRGVRLAWDNVSTASESLGYVVATHQSSSARDGPSVLTWYLPLSKLPPAAARKAMLERPLAEWQKMVRDDLVGLHPELEGAITRIDVWRWAHAMVRPVPGFISQTAPAALAAVSPPLFLAQSDLSGLSLFEEAHYWGTHAAEAAMRHLGHSFESLI
jgi:glycine/D-amino acid oxidase-like deaminating enzyme